MLMQQPDVTPTSRRMEITPEMAQAWLSTANDGNRRMRRPKADDYARDMAQGRWADTGEAIKFDHHGRMIDGQHRMLAQVLSGVTLTYMVVTNLEPDAQSYLDSGMARTPGDALSLHGETNPGLLASMARLDMAIEAGHRVAYKIPSCTHADVFEWLDNHPEARHAATLGWRSKGSDCPISPTAYAYTYMILARVDADHAREFLEGVASGANLSPGAPQLAVRNRIWSARERRIATRGIEIVVLLVRAWNAWRSGKIIRTMPYPQPGTAVPRPR